MVVVQEKLVDSSLTVGHSDYVPVDTSNGWWVDERMQVVVVARIEELEDGLDVWIEEWIGAG